ncbi:hypothetical protein DPMN_039920 [Dreissena polymorpha]|uniref:Uncharacterized protein n=1 Tax=Dreissena polymorpha TaxID=45954 RepID=A0A9D4HUH7_DREPO|nr:hypothetical protein DPMN_039920 [Dreissena polymorpha]
MEPLHHACSKYDYEAKLLERVIQNEMALKDTFHKKLQQMRKSRTLGNSTRREFEIEGRHKRTGKKKIEIDEKVGSVIISMLTNVTALTGDLKSTQQKELATMNLKLKDAISELETKKD